MLTLFYVKEVEAAMAMPGNYFPCSCSALLKNSIELFVQLARGRTLKWSCG
jgi:hypothetical protein